jgi:chemotaxis protein MotA
MPATLVGLIIAAVGTFVGGILHNVSPVFLLTNITALLVVLVGAGGATMASFELPATTGVFKAILVTLFPKSGTSPADTIKRLVEFARKARHEGLLALESEVGTLDDAFMKRGLQLAIDGSDPEAVAQVMKTDIKAMKARHKVSAEWCMTFGIFAPTFGIIGAVIGLIETMGNLNDPDKLGYGIGSAFCATFLGVYLANGVMLPMSNRMKRLSTQEAAQREMVMEGVLAIQGGQNPRVIEETLLSYLPPQQAASIREASGV